MTTPTSAATPRDQTSIIDTILRREGWPRYIDVLVYGVTAVSSAVAYLVPPAARDSIVRTDEVARAAGGAG